MLEKRRRLSGHEAKRLSARICDRIIGIPAVSESRTIGIYIPIGNEVGVDMLLSRLHSRGKKVFVPVVAPGRNLRFARLRPSGRTVKGADGAYEPAGKSFAKKIDAFVIPGLAFDLSGFRIGWGRGYYDRFLSRNPLAVRIGAAYDFQLVKKIGTEPHDMRMDYIATEKRLLEF